MWQLLNDFMGSEDVQHPLGHKRQLGQYWRILQQCNQRLLSQHRVSFGEDDYSDDEDT